MKKQLPTWCSNRGAACLVHMTSLPSYFGIGNLGKHAYEFVDFLKASGFSSWQTCPVGPTGYGDSPYQVFSSFAGNPYLIDWEPLMTAGLIENYELEPLYQLPRDFVDYGLLYERFFPLARLAHSRFSENTKVLSELYGSYENFHVENQTWLPSYTGFQSYKKQFSSQPWWKWPKDHRTTFPVSAKNTEYDFQVFLQYLFRGQWKKLRSYGNSLGISFIGDLPIYAAPDSSEVWADPALFQVDEKTGEFTHVAGVPPDYFNADGQFWGNPLYQWEVHQQDDFSWWMDRLAGQLELFDVVRIDHFRGFHDYWSIPNDSKDAKLGTWKKGPGLKFWKVAEKRFPELPFLAEDLGLISEQVRDLRDSAGLPGMAVLQFAFDGNTENLYLPHNLKESLVLYTGTHDNDTTQGWYESSSEEVRGNFRNYLNVSGDSAPWDLLRFAYRTISPLVVVPVQDLLSLGSEARLNEPGFAMGNWKWRLSETQLGDLFRESSSYLRLQAEIAGRLPLSFS